MPEGLPDAAGHFPGLDELLQMLRDAGLAVGPGEAIDAARVVRHRAAAVAPGAQTREALRFALRPALCKALVDQPVFDEVFERWSRLPPLTGGPAPGPEPSPLSPPGTGTDPTSIASQAGPPPRPWLQRWPVVAGIVVLAVLLGAGAWWYWKPDRPVVALVPNPFEPAAPASAPASAPVIPPSARPDAIAIYGYFPAQRYNVQIRAPWLWGLVLAISAGIALLLVGGAPLPFVSRRRGGGSLTLQAWPAIKHLQHLVLPIAPAVEGQLQRHVKGAVGERQAYARRPLLDPRRTVEATLGRLGLPTPRYRYARLRPAYLVLVHAERDDDLGILWAERLRRLDVQVDVFRFTIDPDGGVPRCHEVGGAGRRLPFDTLPNPAPGQRLVVIADPGVLHGPDGRVHGWVRAARLNRWQQRALFTPEEPHWWNAGQVAELERRRSGDPGMWVFPFDDNALAAWSTWLARERLPEFELADPQLYPRLLRENAAAFVGDADAAALAGTPQEVGKAVSRLVSQLQAYLGANGFYWLCACAVPPLVDRRLALLLGEQYFLRCNAGDERTRRYMAANWRRLVRLPWLRDESQLPQWLRLALLARLPEAIQNELREVVRGTLVVQEEGAGSAGARLGFDVPDPNDLSPGPRHALYVGFVRNRLTAESLVLRLGAGWERWLPGLIRRPRWWRRAGDRWARLSLRGGVAGNGPGRWAGLAGIALVALGAAGSWGLATMSLGERPAGSRRWLSAEVAHTVVMKHDGGVRTAVFSPDGTRIVTASSDGAARVWDAAGGAPLGAAMKHQSEVLTAAFSPDGMRIVTASGDGTARVWDAASGALLGAAMKSGDSVLSAAFSPDGTRIVTTSSDTARVWDAASGAPVGAAMKHEGWVRTAAFSPDGTRIVTASYDGTARVWDAAGGAPLGAAMKSGDSVLSAAFSPDGTRIVTASGDGTARVWDAASGAPLGAAMKSGNLVLSAAFSPDGTRIVTASGDAARVWDAASGAPLGTAMKHAGTVNTAAFSPDGTRIVTASDDGTARVWDAAGDAPLGAAMKHERTVYTATFSRDGTRIVTASDDGTARVWNAAGGAPTGAAMKPGGWVRTAAFSPDGRFVVTASSDDTARLWAAASGVPLGAAMRHASFVYSAAFSPDGTRIVTASEDRTARVWDAASGVPIGAAMRHAGPVEAAAFSPDGTRIVTASGDGTARVWDAYSGAPLAEAMRHRSPVNAAAFSPDGTRIVTASNDRTARVWNAASGAPVGAAMWHEGAVNAAAFSPDGTRIVTASDDRTAQAWDAAGGAPVGAAMRHQGRVRSAAFSPDGTRIVTASDDRSARVWDAATGALLGVPFQGLGPVVIAAWSPDGELIVVASGSAPRPVASAPPTDRATAETPPRARRLPGDAAYVVHAPAPAPAPVTAAGAAAGLVGWMSDRPLWSQALPALMMVLASALACRRVESMRARAPAR